MPQWRDFLERFRPAGTPGAAARPGVPADRSADAAAELTPLLELLDEAQDEVNRIRREAAERADAIRRTAHQQGEAIVARARRDVEHIRAAAEAQTRGEAVAAQTDLRAQTAAELERLQNRVSEQMPLYVDKVVAAARDWLDRPSAYPTGVIER